MPEYALAVTRAFFYSLNVVTVSYKRGNSAPNERERVIPRLETLSVVSVIVIQHAEGLRFQVKPSVIGRRAAARSPAFGPVRFAEKTSRNTVPADLLREKNTVSAEKTS